MRLSVAAFAILVAPFVAPFAVPSAKAAWFTDNGDREALAELRAIPDDLLDPAARAILRAANATGWISIPGCGWGSNAVLVTAGGQDYAITSLHLLTGKMPGDVHCEPGLGAIYMPNAAYITPVDEAGEEVGKPGPEWLAFTRDTVDLEPNPVNFTRAGAAAPWVGDWVAYRLSRNVSDQIMPEGAFDAGNPRGSIPWSSRQNPGGPVWVIGYDGRFGDENGWQFSWQECQQRKMRLDNGLLYLNCDVSPGASSSLIATMEGGALTLQGIITASMEPLIGTDIAVPDSAFLWNIGTTSRKMRDVLEPGAASEKEAKGWGILAPWLRE